MSLPGFPGSTARRLTIATAACCALLVVAVPSASGVPASDGQGYVDSTARCPAPDVVVAFGSTARSRVAICKSADGQYEYRGVRVSDGAKLILAASSTGDGEYVAKNDGVSYSVSSNGLVVSAGSQVIRDEPMVDYHGTASTTTSTPKTTSPPKTVTTPPPAPIAPLPAEVGGSSS